MQLPSSGMTRSLLMQPLARDVLESCVAGGQRAMLAIATEVLGRIGGRSTFRRRRVPDDAVRGVGAAGRLPDLTRRRRHRNEIEVFDVAARRLRPAIVRRN
jgi:hypothetical protein